jgi:hypothetical protein
LKLQPITLASGAGFISLILKIKAYINLLRVKMMEQVNIPRMLLLCLGDFVILPDIDKAVRVVAEGLANEEGALPWRRQLVHPVHLLDQPKYQVTFLESSTPDSAAMLAPQALLVDGYM